MTRRIVVQEISYLLAIKTAAELVFDELNHRRALRPICRGNREEIRIAQTVGRSCGAITRRGARYLVFIQFLRQRLSRRCPPKHDRHRAFSLLTLIGLDCRRYLVFDVDFITFDTVAFDTTPPVYQIDVVLVGRTDVDANDLRRSGTVA